MLGFIQRATRVKECPSVGTVGTLEVSASRLLPVPLSLSCGPCSVPGARGLLGFRSGFVVGVKHKTCIKKKVKSYFLTSHGLNALSMVNTRVK